MTMRDRRSRNSRKDAMFSSMIEEDYREPANLPQAAMYREYPAQEYINGFDIDDGRSGIDRIREREVDLVDKRPSKVKSF